MGDVSDGANRRREPRTAGSRGDEIVGARFSRSKRKKGESVAEMIDRLLISPVQMTTNNEMQKVSSLQAIMLQLSQKAYAGNIRAKRVLLQYKEFARTSTNKKPRLVFVDDEYTRAVAEGRDHDGILKARRL
jgi:hypothetical protein